MFSQMDNLLLDLALLTVGTHRLVVGAVLITIPLNLDRSYVDGVSFVVVFIFDTTNVSTVVGGAPKCRLCVAIGAGIGSSGVEPYALSQVTRAFLVTFNAIFANT